MFAGCKDTSVASGLADKKESFEYRPDKARTYRTVTAENAQTMDELRAKGFVVTGGDSEMFACGESCDAQYDYVKFMGRKSRSDNKSRHLFTCPRPENDNEWLCEPFYGEKGQVNG
jgi:hypothetical protein